MPYSMLPTCDELTGELPILTLLFRLLEVELTRVIFILFSIMLLLGLFFCEVPRFWPPLFSNGSYLPELILLWANEAAASLRLSARFSVSRMAYALGPLLMLAPLVMVSSWICGRWARDDFLPGAEMLLLSEEFTRTILFEIFPNPAVSIILQDSLTKL